MGTHFKDLTEVQIANAESVHYKATTVNIMQVSVQ
jgi:hypothetical protein